jgi:hypothetical protein
MVKAASSRYIQGHLICCRLLLWVLLVVLLAVPGAPAAAGRIIVHIAGCCVQAVLVGASGPVQGTLREEGDRVKALTPKREREHVCKPCCPLVHPLLMLGSSIVQAE